jgi:hypothetical protein
VHSTNDAYVLTARHLNRFEDLFWCKSERERERERERKWKMRMRGRGKT